MTAVKHETLEETKYKVGAVTFLDVLGWKGIWQTNPDAIGQLRNFIEEIKTCAHIESERLSIQYEDLRGVDPVILSISDTVAIFSVGSAPGSLALHAAICKNALPESVSKHLPIRGATSYGEFSIDESIMLGQAVDEAASWHETCDWIGVHLAPSAYLKVERKLPVGWIPYEPPYKNYKFGITGCVEWGYQKNHESIEKRFFEMGPHDPSVAHKYLNTLKYLDKLAEKVKIVHKYRIKFETEEVLPRMGDYNLVQCIYSIIDAERLGLPDEKSYIKWVTVQVKLTGSLLACWNKQRENNLSEAEKNSIIFEYAWRELKKRVGQGEIIPEEFELVLASYNTPTELEFDPKLIQVKLGFEEMVEAKR